MNMSDNTYADDGNSEYSVKFRNTVGAATGKRSQQPTLGRRRGKTPQQFNGIHRRRRKKIRW
jgi:hypothetical protein